MRAKKACLEVLLGYFGDMVVVPDQPAQPAAIENPVLPGFNPDPSIVRVGDDYFIATSTFEWFPGVQVHHSRDLRHWQLRTRPLCRLSQLNMLGNPRSGGVWAPCLSYSEGLFYLIFTDVKTWGRGFVDSHNYLSTAPSIDGPWSDPIYLNSSGFDASLFHDEDGRKWLINMVWDHRPGRNQFAGILLQEYSTKEGRLVGEPVNIYRGSGRGLTEAPHLYRRDGYYYLMVAEGGTSWDHCVILARSQELRGPYETAPDSPLLTSADAPSATIQKAGHASLVETPDGDWYLAHLCGRPLGPRGRCPLGRETAIQKVVWTDDGWLQLEQGGQTPAARVPAPAVGEHSPPSAAVHEDFDAPELPLPFQTLRIPAEQSWLSLSERPGFLRLRGQESPRSLHRQSLVARRLETYKAQFTTCVEFSPSNFQQLAGLLCFYDDQNFFYLAVTHDEEVGKCLRLLASENEAFSELTEGPVVLGDAKRVHLRAEFEDGKLWMSCSTDGQRFRLVGRQLDATTLSDEHTTKGIGFTGTFVGMGCHDMSGRRAIADFDYFRYVR